MTEDVESFRLRAREWLAATMPRLAPGEDGTLTEISDDKWPRARELQRLLYDGGFAGICYPREYGGLGLTPAHQRAFNEECAGYEMPLVLNIPTFSIAPVALSRITFTVSTPPDRLKRSRSSSSVVEYGRLPTYNFRLMN